MRIMVTIYGKLSVHEIVGFEPQNDGTVLLTTPDGCVDLIVTDINEARRDAVCRELLRDGYANISEYNTIYDSVAEEPEEEDCEIFTGFCHECNSSFDFDLTAQIAAQGYVICPHCGEKLSFDFIDNDEGMISFHQDDEVVLAEVECPECKASIPVRRRDFIAGKMTCEFCDANLEVFNEEDE